MNSLKNVAMVAILALVGYAVYVSLNNSPVKAPPEIAEDWTGQPPEVSLPGMDAGATGFAMEGTSGYPSPGVPPAQPRTDPSPRKSYLESAPAPPFSPAPLPPELASQVGPPLPPGPVYAAASPPIGSNAVVVGGPGSAPLPDFRSGSLPPLPPESPRAMAGGSSAPGAGGARDNKVWPEFAEFLAGARRDLAQGRFRETLAILSSRYGEQGQTSEEARALIELLDQVAGTVIYSREHHLEPACVVQEGETLAQIAERYGVSQELLAKINGIGDPLNVQPGRELKVIRGPFRAVVKLGAHEMDLWLQDLYAGRFRIGVGVDKPDLAGAYQVIEKNREPAYHSPTGRIFDPGDPLNPLGRRHIGLGESVAIHGTSDEASIGQTGGAGGIRLGERDVDDVFDILTLGSNVVIQP
ncbi:MAG: L,D-transpeptidase family protein [Thermoguttaceae bacterium]